jgi:hypothetical protein
MPELVVVHLEREEPNDLNLALLDPVVDDKGSHDAIHLVAASSLHILHVLKVKGIVQLRHLEIVVVHCKPGVLTQITQSQRQINQLVLSHLLNAVNEWRSLVGRALLRIRIDVCLDSPSSSMGRHCSCL